MERGDIRIMSLQMTFKQEDQQKILGKIVGPVVYSSANVF